MLNFIFALIGGILIYNLIMLIFARKNQRTANLNTRLDNVGKLEFVISAQDENLNKSFIKKVVIPLINKITGFIFNFLPNKKSEESKLAADLKAAGIWISPKDYTSKSIAIFIFFSLIGVVLALLFNLDIVYIILFALFFMFIGYVFRKYSLKNRIIRRKNEIQNQMPGILDLLCISVNAGLGFDQALCYVTEKNNGALIEELKIARREITLGKTRKESLVDLAERCDVEELKTFVGAINQSNELGISLKNVLIAQSSSIRLSRKQIIEEKAMKTPIKILFPIIIFIFPVIFIVILGPAILDLTKVLNGM